MLKVILFDLDNTLYPKSLGVFDRVAARIRGYLTTHMGYDEETAGRMRQEYLGRYGSTMRGLMIHQNLDPAVFLSYVHDVGVENLVSPNPALGEFLRSIPFEKAIFTSADRPHAQKVLRCLGVEEHFPRIFDIVFTRYIPKPNPEPYRQILEDLGMDGGRCMLVEDMPANLGPAKELGMTTVLVGQTDDEDQGDRHGHVDYKIREILELREVLRRN